MLQPRVVGQSKTPWKFWAIICCFLCNPQPGIAQHSTDEPYVVEPTPALKLNDEDLTTVLLLNNENRAAHGRYLNVRPAVGLLTSTARTFIQEGVTTEYATQVLGTTLDNGRLYAQLLKKSSRVLYDKETVSPAAPGSVSTVTGQIPTALFSSQKSILQSHNDLVADQDWQLIDDHLLGNPKSNLNTYVRNTDFIAPIDNPKGALLVFPTRSYISDENEQPTINQNKGLNAASYVGIDRPTEQLLERRSNESFSISKSSSSSTSSRGGGGNNAKIAAQKVQPAENLPTFTVKNVFAPSGFFWDSNSDGDKKQDELRTEEKSEFRSPKLLYHRVTDDERILSTVTYYGFADFTTVVGDTVIVFSPSTSTQSINPEHITSIKGEATLGLQDASHVTHVPITVTQDLIEPTFTLQTVATISPFEERPTDMRVFNPQVVIGLDNDDDNHDDQDDPDIALTMPETTPQPEDEENGEVEEQTTHFQEETTLRSTEEEHETTEEIPIQGSEVIELESSMTPIHETTSNDLTPRVTESSTIKMLSTPSNEDILKIYASLASAEAAKKMSAEEIQKKMEEMEKTEEEKKEVVSEPEIKIFGGATTIFFEDDPFQAFETAKATDQQTTVQPTQVPTTEKTNAANEGQDEVDRTTEESGPIVELTTMEEKGTTNLTSDDATEEGHEVTTEHKAEESPITTEKHSDDVSEDCASQIVWVEEPKTLTYLTTFFIPGDGDETSSSIESNLVTTVEITPSTKFNCPADSIFPTPTSRALNLNTELGVVIERPSQAEEEVLGVQSATEAVTEEATPTTKDSQEPETATTTTPMVIVTEKSHVTESKSTNTDHPEEEEPVEDEDDEDDEIQEIDDDAQQSGEEIELIYKTLYTTYTYLTTFFHDSKTTITSRKEIVTNVVTSTVSPSMLRTDLDVTDILSSMTIQPTVVFEDNQVSPTTSVGIGRPTTKFVVQQSDLVQIDDILREDINTDATEILSDKNIAQNGVNTLYTTYTYYTTIFVDGETEVMSRTEVHTNYIAGAGSEISPTAQSKVVVDTVSDEDNIVLDIKPTTSYETIQRSSAVHIAESPSELSDQTPGDKFHMSYSTVTRTGESEVVSKPTDESTQSVENTGVVMVTDVRSSSSDGDRHIIENINKQWNGLLEDQISSESNTEDILPSPTLLLQTSYTTFTFYTTMYSGTATNVVSRLETVTNVVTETLQPTQTVSLEDATLPITYFTTFTYWTTLAKDGQITTISREETVSNVVTPSVTVPVEPTSTEQITSTKVADNEEGVTYAQESVFESSVNKIEETAELQSTETSTAIEPTTFYTTYTYYTTSYAGDDTIINSRFETVTNIVTPTATLAGRAIDITAADLNKLDANADKNSVKLDPVFALPTSSGAQPVEQLSPTNVLESNSEVLPTISDSIVALNKGKIVDAEGISTIFYTTQAIATTIDGQYSELIQSTSSINVDEIKKALSTSDADPSSKTYKTGLVRLIEGTMIANRTTTLYQSKVIGTIIEGRYAQIIESTSSFLIEKTLSPSTAGVDISPTSIQSVVEQGGSLQTAFTPTPSSDVVESSINEGKDDQESQTESSPDDDDDEEDGGVDENGRPRSRLTFSTRKRTFTPVIRPFASRNRPQFAPKRKNLTPSSATIITRSDFTPTITATPAIKNDSSRGRFSSIRKSSAATLSSSANVSGNSRRFSRPRSSSSVGLASSSAFPGGSRNRVSSSRAQIQPTSSYFGLSSRRGGGVGSRGGTSAGRFSSVYLGNSRLRIKPTSTTAFDASSNTNLYTTQETDIEEESSTQNLEELNEEDDGEATTENTRRNQNPLLRFRRPPIVGKTPTRAGQVSTRRNPLTQRTKTTTTTTTTTTTSKPRPRAFQRPPIAGFQNRARPQSNLFPPRGLFRPQTINQDLEEENKKTEEENEFGDDLDTEGGDYEDEEGDEDEDEEEGDNRRRRRESDGIKRRSKRQVDYGSRNFRNRFRRPTTVKNIAAEDRIDSTVEEEPATPKTRSTGRYAGRNHQKTSPIHTTNSRIRPTKPSVNGRAQFTLREKDTVTKPARASNFRRPTTSGISTRRTATTIGRPKAPRLKSYTNSVTESTYTPRSTSGRTRQTTSRGRSTTRSRARTTDYHLNEPAIPNFDGTITVTHHIPTEITIPVVNGKVTEYKNVVTAKVSTEIVGPNQYNTLLGRNGNSVLVLSREETIVNNNGATEVTQFVLHETPTTSIIFTPTTIRGRRTSFSHIVPSTVYDVENVVSTIQPQIAANAPLANILLSQLLLGNIGLQQQNLNPLIGLGAQAPVPGTPTTEFKTRTTTYVTTVTNEMSTVIPLTFRGKEILTTIVDSSVNVITATEFLTDTIVVTPTMAPVQQVNSFLLPLLLQQQAQQAQQNPLLPLQNTALPQLSDLGAQQLLFQDSFQELDTNRIQKVNLEEFRDIKESEEFPEQEAYRERKEQQAQPTTHHRKRHRKGQKHVAASTAQASPPLETSVITLYVSGRRPEREGWSRDSQHQSTQPLPNTPTLEYASTATAAPSMLQTVVAKSEVDDEFTENEGRNFFGFGGFSLSSTPLDDSDDNERYDSGNDESITPASIGDEARYNLATRVMSNGVEVIVASDKSKPTHKQSVFRILPSNLYKPLTLAPSTLKDQMVLVMPSEPKNNLTISINPNQFVTKTCLTTYTYRTTYLQDGTTTVESREKVISNIATEERNYLKISPTASFGVTLTRTPELAVGVFHTTYTYLNTILNGNLPIVMSSKHTVTNTITGPDDYISFLQPSEEATPLYETNTYYSKITMTKTLKDSDMKKIISTSNILTQVIVTESLPPKSTSVITSYVAFDIDETSTAISGSSASGSPESQFVIYTYYDKIENANNSSSEQEYIKKPSAAALTLHDDSEKTNPVLAPSTIFNDHHAYSTAVAANSINIYNPGSFQPSAESRIHVYATKTYLTTFTYFTTLLKNSEHEVSSTVLDSHTRVIENVITESIPNYMLDSKLLEEFSQELINPTKKHAIITVATLLGGQSLEVTAMNMLKPMAIIKTANLINSSTKKAGNQNSLNGSDHSIASYAENIIADVDNTVVDNAEAESENDEVYTDEYGDGTKVQTNNTTKIHHKTEFPMANLIGSFNLNGLTALGPVFNAMAGLIQNNLGSAKQRNVTVIKHLTHAPERYPSPNISSYDTELDQDHHSPIYIPVQEIHHENDPNNFYITSQASPTSLHISPPEKWPVDEKMNRNNKLEFALSKPSYETPLLNGGIPISPGEVITANSDVIVGKPAGTRPRVPFNTKLKNSDIMPNVIPLNQYQDIRNGVDKHFDTFIRPPPPLSPPQKYAQKQTQFLAKKNYPQHNPGPHILNVPNFSNVQNYPNVPLLHQLQPPGTLGGGHNRDVPNNEILEIKRIPEVYSTDLPPVEIGFHRHHIKKVINTENPMLVNIKPSQVANVVIPHGNTNSVLIIESTPELHKSGQYFDEPSAYPNTIIRNEPSSFDKTAQKPILSNQQINLDSHVLSHNVDIHVPPITFKKENDFPYSTPVRGQIHKNGQFQMAHVKIPPTDHEIEVNLTPQHVSLPNSYLQPQNEPMRTTSALEDDQYKDDINTSVSFSSIPRRPSKDQVLPHPEVGAELNVKVSNTQRVTHNDHEFVIRPPGSPSSVSGFYDEAGSPFKVESLLKLHPTNGNGYQLENQRHPGGFDFGSNRMPQGVHRVPQASLSPPKRRPVSHVLPVEKPFGGKLNKINPPTYKPRPIIPLSTGNYGINPHFATIQKPRPPSGIPLIAPSTSRPTASSLPSKVLADFPVNRNELDVARPPQSSIDTNYYYVQDVNRDTEQSQAPSLIENVTYDHRDDDYENEEGEVVQESNSLPVIPGQYLAKRPDMTVPPDIKLQLSSSTTERLSTIFGTSATTTTRPTRPKITLTTTKRVMIPTLYMPARPSEINNLRNNNVTLLSGSILNPPPRGRPFTLLPGSKHRPSSALPFRPTISHGEKFRKPVNAFSNYTVRPEENSIHGVVDNLHAYLQVSLPINPRVEDEKNGQSLTQTEAPFNPKYTQRPQQNKSNSNLKINLDGDGVMSSTTSRSTDKTKLKSDMDRESGEEIFDFRESNNPHNLGVINNLEDIEAKVPTATIKQIDRHSDYDVLKKLPSNQRDTTTVHPLVSEPSMNMRPPSLSPVWKTEEVMGLSPPPPPTSMSPPPVPYISSSSTPTQPLYPPPLSPPNSTGYNTISFSTDEYRSTNKPPLTSQLAYRGTGKDKFKNAISRRPDQQQIHSAIKIPRENEVHPNTSLNIMTTTTKKKKYDISATSADNTTSENEMTSFNNSPTGESSNEGESNQQASTSKSPTNKPLFEGKRKANISWPLGISTIDPTPSMKGVSPSTLTQQTVSNLPIERSPYDNTSQMVNHNQQIPEDILILGSESSAFEEPIFTVRVSSDGRRRTTPLLNITSKSRPISKVGQATKYITNTKTLTVTTTKTTVVRSQGVPSTQTLTLTKTRTSTIVDTITETETETQTQTHTLLQPTKVTISSPPEIKTTVTTIYTLPEHQNYPTFPAFDIPSKGVKGDEAVLFVEDSETNLDELIINYENKEEETETSTTTTTTVITSKTSTTPETTPNEVKTTRRPAIPIENDSIFVVMTDQKKSPGMISINMSMMDGTPTIDTVGTSDYETIPFDLPNRDEDHENQETNHVLLGGILIASPPKTTNSFNRGSTISQCKPDCKASRNELCQRIEGVMRCVCRPGFARMFPDRPCKPTYTYSLSLPIYRFGKEVITYDDRLSDTSSEEFFHLAGITHEALDRMVMQSDFRDVYHGVHITGFQKTPKENGVISNFYLQLSDNSDDSRLVDVFKKYLRSNNYSIGGTELHIAKSGVDELRARDFNECLDPQFHDCSENSQCFNLQGTYTCSCKEGYADLSENPVYPGRKCSADLIGCEKCYYHGTCYTPDDMEQPLCECFHWYAGASCQINLKILLIALIAIGVSLLILLLFCILVTCSKRHKAKRVQSLIAGINILPPKNARSLGGNLKIDKRAMIKDSSSEASHNSDTLPYVSRKDKKHSITSSQPHNQRSNTIQRNNVQASSTQAEVERRCNLLDQNDRSLTVMIPRAKYHPILSQSSSHLNLDVRSTGGGAPISSAAESKILSYLDAGGTATPSKKISSASSKHAAMHSTTTGALVSAGFEVSATVGHESSSSDEKSHVGQKGAKAGKSPQSQYSGYKKSESSTAFLDSMDNWLDTMPHNELTVSEARSYDETTIQPPTRSISRSVYEKQLSQINNDEANTMAERDVGSTFLLPHTHLYKPDRGSDISGFDSF